MKIVASEREDWTNDDPESQWGIQVHAYVRATGNDRTPQAMLESVMDLIEDETESTLGRRTITATMYPEDLRQDGTARLPRGPVTQIVSCIDANGNAVANEYRCSGKDDRILFRHQPAFPVTVVYKAGHAPIPGGLKRCIFANVAEEFDNRTTAADGPQKPWIQRTYDFYRRGSPVG